jgi:hypothetical protein
MVGAAGVDAPGDKMAGGGGALLIPRNGIGSLVKPSTDGVLNSLGRGI